MAEHFVELVLDDTKIIIIIEASSCTCWPTWIDGGACLTDWAGAHLADHMTAPKFENRNWLSKK